ncbi:MAG: erythromycin esterase family protein [Flavobacteriaceae bacterium]
MKKVFLMLLLVSFVSCRAQTSFDSKIVYTSTLETFEPLSHWEEALKGVEILALGENTHGMAEVFKAKTDLVKFLHEELGFNLVLFESGFGDAALAWEKLDSMSAEVFTRSFTSNFYYHSSEIKDLMDYVKAQNKTLKIQGFDCQPQQDFLIQRMTQIIQPIDSIFAKSVKNEMRNFNQLYQYEQNKDSVNFYKTRERFISFLKEYDAKLEDSKLQLLKNGTTSNEIETLKRSNDIFRETYEAIKLGEILGWPISNNIRDAALFNIVEWFRANHPGEKIIIWAQNSHIENLPKPNYNVTWMGHLLKETYGEKYYSVGSVVYRGNDLRYSGVTSFEHNDTTYLANHLHAYQKKAFVLDLRKYPKNDFLSQPLLGMENNGNTAQFIAKERFDGVLFIDSTDIPTLFEK